ncbi:helix-turn-helix transcriptional regulator [Clostridium sp. 19966]|uniref:helix-turn-helix domain-containing protein n=1 Tax=Clostridium sp. 19966 TaxID=2768166 RepID=UPI0028E08ADF|nr:helix-turn-helix transcriptional regulator [Clostridium sp. 19966]MDT8718486.1 helix-turn-helix transcriptional regulator [Clostridium sp. 19966]
MSSLSLQEIKENISLARKQAGITQEQMSKLLNITQPAYSYYEKGEKPIPLNKIQKICEILSIPMSSLIGDMSENIDSQEILVKINGNLSRIADTLDKLYEFAISK